MKYSELLFHKRKFDHYDHLLSNCTKEWLLSKKEIQLGIQNDPIVRHPFNSWEDSYNSHKFFHGLMMHQNDVSWKKTGRRLLCDLAEQMFDDGKSMQEFIDSDEAKMLCADHDLDLSILEHIAHWEMRNQ